MSPQEVLSLFNQTGALLDGHFVLRSGLHSRRFFQCALLLQHPAIAAKLCAELAGKLEGFPCDGVISPALGGIIAGHEVARALGKRHIFSEKEDGKLVLRRGFEIGPGERFLVIEDVVTRGGRVRETLGIIKEHGGEPVAVGALVDRSGGQAPDFGCMFVSLMKLDVETWEPDNLPADLAAMPVTRPGSK